MSLSESIDIYSPTALMAVMLSATLFLLYSIINLIDMNGYIKNFNILDVGTYDRGTMIYAYIAGYYMFLLKVIIALITLFILTLILRITVSTIMDVFTQKSNLQSGGAAQIQAGAAESVNLMKNEVVRSNLKYILGFTILKSFVILFLIIIPLFLFFALFAYTKFYDQEQVQNHDKNNAPKIMLTHHNFLIYLIVSLFIITFIYSIYLWFKISNENIINN
jgi:hypothetical protein